MFALKYQKNSRYTKNSMRDTETCRIAEMAIRDTLDVVGGKWKLILISILRDGPMRFNELSREAGISPRILSKELTELQMNGLVKRVVSDTKPVTVTYQATDYSKTLDKLIDTLQNWGISHREYVRTTPIERPKV